MFEDEDVFSMIMADSWQTYDFRLSLDSFGDKLIINSITKKLKCFKKSKTAGEKKPKMMCKFAIRKVTY